ncbi:MAG: ABC transporter permease [Lachnospiraceae bacterium]|nr:ABC transporter permease [Lachnospiraceae bacterium]
MKKDVTAIRKGGMGRSVGRILISIPELTIIISIILISILIGAQSESFFTSTNLLNISKQISVNGIIAVGMMLAIIAKGVDLSVGSMVGVICVVAGSFIKLGLPAGAVLMVCLLTGAVCGGINGLLIVKLQVKPIIVTLATMNIFRGITYVYSGGKWVTNLPKEFLLFGNGVVPAVILLVVLVLFTIIMKYTSFGRHVYAIGSNEESAKLAGIRVDQTKVMIFMVSGILTGLAAMLFIGRTGAIQPAAGTGYEMDAIGAAVLGGVSFLGGKGTVLGTIMGAVLMGLILNGMTLLKISANYQGLITGLIIILALLLDTVRTIYGERR